MLVANKLFTIYFVNIISVGTMHQITVAVGVSPVLIVVQRKYSQPFPAAAKFLTGLAMVLGSFSIESGNTKLVNT